MRVDAVTPEWVRRFGCIGVSVEYRLAPETPYPGALDDCRAVFRWVHENADELRVDRSRIGVAGTSAGAVSPPRSCWPDGRAAR